MNDNISEASQLIIDALAGRVDIHDEDVRKRLEDAEVALGQHTKRKEQEVAQERQYLDDLRKMLEPETEDVAVA